MGRPEAISNDEILAAARAVFLAKGISATVGDVALRCGVGEATIFRRYPTKHALFLASLDTSIELSWERMLDDSSGEVDARVRLRQIAHEILTMGRKVAPLVALKLSNPTVGERRGPPPSLFRAIDGLRRFFASPKMRGRIRTRDARSAARIFFGSIHSFVLLEQFANGDAFDDDIFLDDLVDVICAPIASEKKRKPAVKRKKNTK